MPEHHFDIGVIVARRKLKGPWADHAWLPHAVLPAVPAAAPWTSLGAAGDNELYYAGFSELTLHSSQAAHYRDNLALGRPSLWVSLRIADNGACEGWSVTADPYEGEALIEGIGNIVEAVPMPSEIGARIAVFVDAFHVERPFFKRDREHADPHALGHKPAPPADPHPERR